MPRGAPPPGRDQPAAVLRFNIGEVCDAGIRWVSAEAVLLVVGGAEDVVTYRLGREDKSDAGEAEVERVDGEVAGLEGVDEGEPDEIAEGEHEAEAIGGDVDGGEHGGFHIEGVEDVKSLEGREEEDGVGDGVVGFVLVGDVGEVEEDPAEHAGAELAEDFDVEEAEEGEVDARVEFAADKPVVD